jgi:hypothetical protein
MIVIQDLLHVYLTFMGKVCLNRHDTIGEQEQLGVSVCLFLRVNDISLLEADFLAILAVSQIRVPPV